jgi:cytochrome c551/c552
MRPGFWFAALLYLLSAAASARAQTAIDPHALFETRCARCHGDHAGDFVASGLRKTDSEIAILLRRGHGGLRGGEAEILAAQLAAIRQAGGLYREKCRICHDPAVDLARRELALRDGRLTGRYSGHDIESFLRFHGRLSPDEQATILKMLTRQLATDAQR